MHICCVYIRNSIHSSSEFAHYDLRYDIMPLGISYISASLKQAGHTTEMLFCVPGNCNEGILRFITKTPDVFAVSVVSENDFELAGNIFTLIKKHFPDAKIFVGGSYPTLVPELVFEDKRIDVLCVGDGEKAAVDYMRQLESGKFVATDNLWIRTDSSVIKCCKSVFTEDLDNLAYPDRAGWDRWVVYSEQHKISLERGCVYRCTYCANHALSQTAQGRYVRYRSIKGVIDEIEHIKKSYSAVKSVYFDAENALSDIEYFRKFCLALADFNDKSDIKLNFSLKLNFTPNLLKDGQLVELIKQANINWIHFGLESGSFEIRKKFQRPYYTNEQVIRFCEMLKERKIKILIHVMYCFPFETKKTYGETVTCLKKCKADMISLSWLTPIKNTKLYGQLEDALFKKASITEKFRYLSMRWRVYKTYKDFKEALFLSAEPLRYFDKAVNFYKGLKEKRHKKDENYKRKAKEEFDKGNFGRAVKYFNKVHITENESWIYGDRAIAEMNTGRYKAALKDFDKALQFCPDEVYRQKKEECLSKIKEAD